MLNLIESINNVDLEKSLEEVIEKVNETVVVKRVVYDKDGKEIIFSSSSLTLQELEEEILRISNKIIDLQAKITKYTNMKNLLIK